jgi:hypothetical protein
VNKFKTAYDTRDCIELLYFDFFTDGRKFNKGGGIQYAQTIVNELYEDYPILRKDCRNRDKMIRLWSVVGGSMIGVGSVATAGTFGVLAVLSSAGLSMLVPTLASHLLSTEEKLELIDKEYRQRYRCPNPNCRDSFGNREFELVAKQKKCTKCKAVWVK